MTFEAPEVVVQGVYDDAERNVTLELGSAAVEHQPAALFGADTKLGKQSRLADARLAHKLDEPWLAAPHSFQPPVELGDFANATDQRPGTLSCPDRHS
jgi:hypothetical protein